jgi:HK97 family phage prohead protease
MPDQERRTFQLDRAGLRAAGPGSRFKGHAAIFGERTWIGPERFGFWEEVVKGAFDRALQEDDVRFLLEHDPRWVLGRTAANTLRLSTDKRGLVVDADLPDTTYAADAAVSMERGDLDQMSFAFAVRDDGENQGEEWSRLKDGTDLRRLTDLRLYDVSLVAYPAYEGTDAALRACEARRATCRTETFQSMRARLEAARKGW